MEGVREITTPRIQTSSFSLVYTQHTNMADSLETVVLMNKAGGL